MKYYVRTTGQREFNYDLEYEELRDNDSGVIDSFIKQIEYISKSDSVLLEDDLILCKDFKEKIEKIIEQYPNDIINFFTCPKDYFTAHYRTMFNFNQCTYYPKNKTQLLAKELRRLRNSGLHIPYDSMEDIALKNLGIRHLVYRPCLVQHIDNDSLIEGRTIYNSRRTPYFIDYLEELNINYEDAYKVENRTKLEKHLEECFKVKRN